MLELMKASPSFSWDVRRKLSAEVECDIARRFSAGSPALLLLLAAYAYGSSCWIIHPTAIVIFGGLFAGAAYGLHTVTSTIVARYAECPARWSGVRRRTACAASAVWAVFTAWAGLAHLNGAGNPALFLLALITAGAAVGVNACLAGDEILTERCLLIVLTPVLVLEIAQGAFALAAVSGLLLAFLIAHTRVQSVTYWERLISRAELEMRVEKAERTLAMVIEAAATPAETSAAVQPVRLLGKSRAEDLASVSR